MLLHSRIVLNDEPKLSDISLFDDSTVTFNVATNTLFARDSGGGLSRIAQVNTGGCIRAVCILGDTFYVAGSFSEINGVSIANIAWSQRYPSTGNGDYTQNTTPFRAVGSGGGPDGQINALFCDMKANKVWAGGRFMSPGRGIAVFDLESSIWSAPPFLGISGARAEVTSITTDCSNSYLFFAGSFITTIIEENVGPNNTNLSNAPFSGSIAYGFGFLEWPRSSNVMYPSIEGARLFSNALLTASGSLGVQLYSALGGTAVVTDDSIALNDIVHHPSGVIFVGGAFALTAGPTSGSSNIIAFTNGMLTALAGNGLNGEVTSLLDGDHLYIGGAFDDTNEGTTSNMLSGIGMYNVVMNTWAPLGAGVDGTVASITLLDDVLHVGGNCTKSGIGDDESGYAAWHIKEGRWIKSGWPTINRDIGFVVGKMSFLESSINAQFVGGFRYRPMWQPVDDTRVDADEDRVVSKK